MQKPALVLGTAVVAANQFNPSVISQLWLVRHGLAGEDDFGPTCIFSPEFVQLGTTTFNLTCTPLQLQVAPVGDTSLWGKVLKDVLGKMLALLPHTPFTAIGLNFHWQVRLDPSTAGETTRRLFAGRSAVYRPFETSDSRFGAYLSKDHDGMRLKLDIKPTSMDGGEAIHLAFNFHRAVADHSIEDMRDALSKWDGALAFSERLSDDIQGEDLDD